MFLSELEFRFSFFRLNIVLELVLCLNCKKIVINLCSNALVMGLGFYSMRIFINKIVDQIKIIFSYQNKL